MTTVSWGTSGCKVVELLSLKPRKVIKEARLLCCIRDMRCWP